MNIDLVGRIRPSLRGELPHSLNTDGHNKLSNKTGGLSCSFQQLHGQEVNTYDVFKQSVEPLLEFCLAGYNTCLVVSGESGSGKSFTVAGDNSASSPSILSLLLQQLFAKIGDDESNMYQHRTEPSNEVHLHMYELYNELLRDLLEVPGKQTEYLDVHYSPEQGAYIRGQGVPISNLSEGISQIRQGISRRINRTTDYGQARNHTALLVYIDILLRGESGVAMKSRFTIIITAGLEKLTEDWQSLRLREGFTLSRSIVAFAQLVATLANQPFPDRVITYSESRLTSLLEDELGGNCRTRVLMCFKPQADGPSLDMTLQLAKQLSSVKNFPISNDIFAQGLVTQYRSKVHNMRHQLGYGPGMSKPSSIHEVHEELKRIQAENIELRDQNEHLHLRMEQIQGKFGSLVTSKTDLSAQLLMTEEEKLKVSKILVDMQIENNKIKEELEATKFELKNKILKLETELTEMELERDRHKTATRMMQEKLADIEQDRKELADEYVSLKANYLAVKKAHEDEVAKMDELSIELLNLANTNAALMRTRDSRPSNSPSAEVDRVRAIVSRHSNRIRLSDLDHERNNIEKNLFGGEEKYQRELNNQKKHHEEEIRRLSKKISTLSHDLQRANQIARERQRHASELHAKLLVLQGTHDQLQSQTNRMQHKLKDVSDDFCSRLVKYIQDITGYMDKSKNSERGKEQMRSYVEQMLNDVKKAHKTREEQLSQAAQAYRQQLTDASQKLERVLVAYRNLRSEIKERDLDLDLGPDDQEFKVTDQELQSTQQKEINRLRQELRDAEKQIDNMSLKLRLGNDSPNLAGAIKPEHKHSWDSLRKEVKDFTLNTQRELEKERAELLTRLAMVEEENREFQDYIDSHLLRYKQEIERLRNMLGMADTGGFISPDKPPRLF